MCVNNLPRVVTRSGQDSNLRPLCYMSDALTTTPPRYMKNTATVKTLYLPSKHSKHSSSIYNTKYYDL